ncbi:MAG: hypothetical protein KatS3mg076_2581 [Candidatus Binatia bacterium]|nr:MAG: hypothetical protein KatS3mg076_2581 [Candidatus Binatia bacterium]
MNWRHVAVSRAGLEQDAAKAARRVLFWVRRGCHYVPAGSVPAALAGFFRFRFGIEPVFLGPPAHVLP